MEKALIVFRNCSKLQCKQNRCLIWTADLEPCRTLTYWNTPIRFISFCNSIAGEQWTLDKIFYKPLAQLLFLSIWLLFPSSLYQKYFLIQQMIVRYVHEDELFKRFSRKCVVFTTIQIMSDRQTGYVRAVYIKARQMPWSLKRVLNPTSILLPNEKMQVG